MKRKRPSVGSARSRSELLTLQRSFAKAIRRPLNRDDTMIGYRHTDVMIAPTQNMKPHDRLELYAQQYWWRIEDSFDEDFTTVQHVLTEKEYLALRDEYLNLYPSRSYTLRNLGDRFAGYIKKCRVLSKVKKDLVFDCASFDWARIEAFDAAQKMPLIKKDLEKTDFIKRKISLQPHVQLLSLKYPVDSLVKHGVPRLSEESSNTLLQQRRSKKRRGIQTLRGEKIYLAVHRYNERILMKRLTLFQYKILQLLEKGTTLSTLVSSLKNTTKVKAQELGSAFHEWISLEWIFLDVKSK